MFCSLISFWCIEWGQWINTGGLKQKHKKQPFSDASASHLSLVLWNVWFQAEAWISHTTSPTPPSYEVGGIAKRIKTARLRRKTNLQKSDYPKALCVLECDDLYLCQIINTQCVILIIGGREVSRPYRVGFSPKASGFYPFGDATDLVRGRRWWCGVADSSICLKSDIPQH